MKVEPTVPWQISDETLQRAIDKPEALPSIPQVYHQLIAAANKPSTSLATLGSLVESDPAISLKLLQLVNTAFFGAKRQTTSVQQAVQLLGLEALKGLVLTAHVFNTVAAKRVPGFSFDHFQSYTLRVARIARMFVSAARADETFTAGILHDIGKLVLALCTPLKFARVVERVGLTGEPQDDVEREIIGVTHSEAGAYLMARWGIPTPIVDAVGYHHHPELAPAADLTVLAAVYAADTLTGIVMCGDPEDRLDRAFLEKAGVLDRLPRWRQLVEEDAARG
jgi:HD-like signal output (HDOD) protein